MSDTVHTLDCQCRACLLKQLDHPTIVQDVTTHHVCDKQADGQWHGVNNCPSNDAVAAFVRSFCTGRVTSRAEIDARIQSFGASIDAAKPALTKYLHSLVEFHMRQAAQDGVDDAEVLVRMLMNVFVVGMVAENVRLEVRGTSGGSLPRVSR